MAMLTVQGKITGEDVPQQQPVAKEKGLECRENRQGGETCTIRCMAEGAAERGAVLESAACNWADAHCMATALPTVHGET